MSSSAFDVKKLMLACPNGNSPNTRFCQRSVIDIAYFVKLLEQISARLRIKWREMRHEGFTSRLLFAGATTHISKKDTVRTQSP